MPGGKRNPLSMSQMLESLGDVVQHGRSSSDPHVSKIPSIPYDVSLVDLNIQFIGASGLPKMDVVGTADPYFIAKIDGRISFVSTVIRNNLSPVWNEVWRIKHVPSTASLRVKVMDKDEGTVTDDYIGEFMTSVAGGAKEVEITGPLFRRARGTFWLKIETTPSANPAQAREFPYLFDGPVRFSRHFSPTVGLFTNLDEARLYSTWKMYLCGIPLFFRDKHQHWNTKYKAAQNIFQGPTSVAVRSGIQAGHRLLYARTSNNGFGIIEKSTDVIELLHGGASRPGAKNASIQMQHANRVKPAIYTYIISSEDDSFRFSETGAAFFVDFASKHALHSNCCETVRYSGEFHPRPKGGWQNFSDDIPDDQVEWELVIDNNSGTYAPDPTMLPDLKGLLEYNFQNFTIYAWDREDPRLKESVEACREYAMKYRGIGKDEFQPTANEGEVTLMSQASMKVAKDSRQGHVVAGQGQDMSQGREGRTHQRYGSSGSDSGDFHSSGQQPLRPQRYESPGGPDPHHYGPAYTSDLSASPPRPPIPPPVRPTLDATLPHTSSDYLKDNNRWGVGPPDIPSTTPNFPQSTLYNPHSIQGHYVPPPVQDASAYGYSYPTNAQPPRGDNNETGSRQASQDYSALPPGCAPPAKFLHREGNV